MGAWGFKAIESDDGLDLIDFLEEYIIPRKTLKLSEMISALKEEDFLGKNDNEIDFFYDNSAMTLVEIYLDYLDKNSTDELVNNLFKNITVFEVDKKSLELLLKYCKDIKNEVPDKSGERETVELWRDSDCFDKWKSHVDYLITGLEKIIK